MRILTRTHADIQDKNRKILKIRQKREIETGYRSEIAKKKREKEREIHSGGKKNSVKLSPRGNGRSIRGRLSSRHHSKRSTYDLLRSGLPCNDPVHADRDLSQEDIVQAILAQYRAVPRYKDARALRRDTKYIQRARIRTYTRTGQRSDAWQRVYSSSSSRESPRHTASENKDGKIYRETAVYPVIRVA